MTRHLLAALFKRLGSQHKELARLRGYIAESQESIAAIYRAEQAWKAEAQMWKARALSAEARAAHPSQRATPVEWDRQPQEIRKLPEVDQ